MGFEGIISDKPMVGMEPCTKTWGVNGKKAGYDRWILGRIASNYIICWVCIGQKKWLNKPQMDSFWYWLREYAI